MSYLFNPPDILGVHSGIDHDSFGVFKAGAGDYSVYGPGAADPAGDNTLVGGYGSYADAGVHRSFGWGQEVHLGGNNSFAGGGPAVETLGANCFALGNNVDLSPGGATNNKFGMGEYINIYKINSFGFGSHISVYGQHSLGFGNQIYCWENLSVGIGHLQTPGGASFSHGYGYGYPGGFNGAYGYASFAQGSGIRSTGSYTLIQGAWYIDVRADCILAQGRGIYQLDSDNDSGSCLLQGSDITIYGNEPTYASLLQGHDLLFKRGANACLLQGRNFSTADLCLGSFVQGNDHNLNDYGLFFCCVQGADHYFGSHYSQMFGYENSISIQGSLCSFVAGRSCDIGLAYESPYSFLHGWSCIVEGKAGSIHGHNFGQGGGIKIYGESCFAQGRSLQITGERSFARGELVKITRDDQTSWGANRVSPLGGAQFNWITKYLKTVNDTQTTIITLDLEEDKAYALWAKVVAYNTDTADEMATLVIEQASAYRKTGGSAVLINSPKSLNSENTGGDPASWAADLASDGNNILLRVTGDADDDVQWMATLFFEEIAG